MIGRNYRYKGLDFSGSVQMANRSSLGYSIFIKKEVHTSELNTTVKNNANYHGGYSSRTFVAPRLFTFNGYIIGDDDASRNEARDLLVSKIQPEPNPGAFNRGIYDLQFTNNQGDERVVSAKVFRGPEPTFGEACDTAFEFSFDLLCETEKIYGSTTKTATGSIGSFGGNTFWTTFPTTFASYAGAIKCNNEGNRASPIRVSIVGNVTNPKIINATNGNKYRITRTTSNLIFDNRNLSNKPSERLIVTDQGTNIKEFRSSGAGIYLDPGANDIVVLADSYVGTPLVTVTYRDAFIY